MSLRRIAGNRILSHQSEKDSTSTSAQHIYFPIIPHPDY